MNSTQTKSKKEDFRLGDALSPYAQRLTEKGKELWQGILRSNGLRYRLFVSPKAGHVDRVKSEIRNAIAGSKAQATQVLKHLEQKKEDLAKEFVSLTTIQVYVPKKPDAAPTPEAYDVDRESYERLIETLKTRQNGKND